jgi:transposase
MEAAVSPLPDNIEALKALLATTIQRADEAEARLDIAHARQSATEAMIAHLKQQISNLLREQYGASAERTRRLLEQMELQPEDLEGDAAQDDLAAEEVAQKTTSIAPFERKKPSQEAVPEHLPRERVVIPAPCACPACGSSRLSKLREDAQRPSR